MKIETYCEVGDIVFGANGKAIGIIQRIEMFITSTTRFNSEYIVDRFDNAFVKMHFYVTETKNDFIEFGITTKTTKTIKDFKP